MRASTHRLAAMGTVALMFLAACAGGAAPEQQEPSAKGEFDWRRFDGSTINALLISHPFVDSLKPLLPEFEELTGITVETEVLAEQPGFEKLLADLSSKTGNYDVFMTDPLHNWQFASGGWIEPLDDYLSNPSLTDVQTYDVKDFVPGIWNAGRWNRELMSGIGEGPVWAVPINYESYLLAYRPSILKAANVSVPTTYEEVLDVVTKLAAEQEETDVFPVITRFDKYWDLPYLTFGTMLQSYGVQMVDKSGDLGICSEGSIEATELFIDIIRTGSPPDAASFTWYEALQGFASGRYAMSLDEADLFAPTYENPKESAIADDVGYAPAPEGPAGRRAGAWIWEMSVNANSQSKDASWLFLQWLTSKDTLVKTHLGGNMNPVRASSWGNPKVAKMVDKWGERPGQYREVVEQMSEVAAIRFPPHPELTRMLDRWAQAVQQSFFDNGNVRENLCAAQAEIDNILGSS